MAYPTSLDNLPTTRADGTVNATTHAGDHNAHATAVNALQAKVGVGASTPAAGAAMTSMSATETSWLLPTPKYVFGVVGPGEVGHLLNSPDTPRNMYAAGIRMHLIEVFWSSAHTADGVFSAAYAASVQTRIDALLDGGPDTLLTLDLGIQYPAGWVLAIDPLKDQYNVTHASVANVHWSTTVRAKVTAYVTWLFANINFRGKLWAIRAGPDRGELKFPDNTVGAGTRGDESLWAYDATAQALMPTSPTNVVGWVPNTGTTTQAQVFYYFYCDRLAEMFEYLRSTLRTACAANGAGRPYICPVTPGAGFWHGNLVDQIVANRLFDTTRWFWGAGGWWERVFATMHDVSANVNKDYRIMHWCPSVGDGYMPAPGTNPWERPTALQHAAFAQQYGRPIMFENPGSNAFDTAGGADPYTTMQYDVRAMEAYATYGCKGLMWIRAEEMGTGGHASWQNYKDLMKEYWSW